MTMRGRAAGSSKFLDRLSSSGQFAGNLRLIKRHASRGVTRAGRVLRGASKPLALAAARGLVL